LTETQIAESYIYSTVATELSGTSLSGCPIWPDVADQGTAWPCIVFSLQSPRADKMVVGDDRILCDLLYQVKVIGKTRKEDIDQYATAIDRCLHGYVGTAGGVLGITRENPVGYTEASGDGKFYHLGGLYRVIVQPAQTLILRVANGRTPYTALLGTRYSSQQSGRTIVWDSALGGDQDPSGTWTGLVPSGTYSCSITEGPVPPGMHGIRMTWIGDVVVSGNKLTPSVITLA